MAEDGILRAPSKWAKVWLKNLAGLAFGLSMLKVYLQVYLLMFLVFTRVLTHCEYGGSGSGTPDTTVEPSGAVVGLYHQKMKEGDSPSEMFAKAFLLLLSLIKYRMMIVFK